jgi:hypothetical protein
MAEHSFVKRAYELFSQNFFSAKPAGQRPLHRLLDIELLEFIEFASGADRRDEQSGFVIIANGRLTNNVLKF